MSKDTTPAALVRSIREYLAVHSDLWTLDGQAMDNMALELARIEFHRRTAAEHAVMHILKRIKADPRLAWLIGLGSESFELLMVAGATICSYDIDPYRQTFQVGLETQQLPGIGEEAVVIDAEMLHRMSVLNDGALDLDDLTHHFLDLGVAAEEAKRDRESGELF